MLRLIFQSCDYSISVVDGLTRRQISASASIPEGILVHGSTFHGPVHVIISEKPLDPPFQCGSIYWGTNASGQAFASLWLYALSETIDRIADRASMLQKLNISVDGALVNGCNWPDPEIPKNISRFDCCFGPISAA
jgi:hypothetical protein